MRPIRLLSSCPSSPVPNFEASIGQTVSATAAEMLTENASTKPNSENRLPTSPGMNETGMNTAASVAVVASTAKTISLVPRTAAARGPAPMARWRAMFSTTTMASSTTRPVATTSASSVMTLIEKPTAQMAASVPISDTGMEIAGAMVARNERRKARMMRMTMTFASKRLMITSRTDSRMNTASSRVMEMSTPAGSVLRSSSTAACTPSEMSMVLACAWRMMSMPIAVLPSRRVIAVAS